MEKMRVLSLFDGISCARVALDKAGHKIETYFASEIDRYAVQIAQKNHPTTRQVGDVNLLSALNLGKIDLLIGGSPCQDLSIAKKDRQGLSGSRSGLFFQYVRLLREVKPKYFVLENVASMPAQAREAISAELGVSPIMIDASLVSAQNRKRFFWTNIPGVKLPDNRGIFLKDVLEKEVDEKYFYSGKIGKSIGNRVSGRDGKSVALRALGGGGGAKTGLYFLPKRAKSNTLRVSGRGSLPGSGHDWDLIEGEDQAIRRLTPIECERLQCLPDGYTEGVSDTQRYKALGNAFNVDVVAHILSFIKE